MDDFSRRQASIKSVLTCEICKKLCKNVTIIEECCHRFCKKCITRKITEEKLKFCPYCNLDLGAAPLQKIRPDHHVQGIRDILSSKRRELIESGLIEDKPKKGEPKKLAHADIDINSSPNMLIDDPPTPPPPPPPAAAVATSSRRKEKSISSIVNTTPPVVDDHDRVSNQHVVFGRRRGRRRGSSRNNANANAAGCFQDHSSEFNNVVEPGSSTIPLLSGKATQRKQQIKGDQPGSSSSTPLFSGKATQHKQQIKGDQPGSSSSTPLFSGKATQYKQQIKGDQPGSSSSTPLFSGKATQYKQQIKGDQPGSSRSTPLFSGKATQYKQHIKGDQPGSSSTPLLSGKATQHKQQIKVDQAGSSSIPFLSGKATQHKQQVESNVYAAESSRNDSISKKNRSFKSLDGMNDLWEPLHKLVTKGVTLDLNSNKSKSKEPVPKFTPIPINLDDDDDEDDDDEDEEYVPTRKIKEHKVSRQNVVQKSNVVVPPAAATPPAVAPSSSTNDEGKVKKGRRGRKKKETNNSPPPPPPPPLPPPPPPPPPPAAAADGTNINVAQVQVTNEAAATKVLHERVHPIWFTLVASDKQECPSPLPQISTRYIKIKDVNMPSSYIKKYLAQKLSLQSGDEVEVRMLGMPIRPALPMHHLAELWLRAAPTTEKTIKVGASAEEFVMVLKYARSHNPQA